MVIRRSAASILSLNPVFQDINAHRIIFPNLPVFSQQDGLDTVKLQPRKGESYTELPSGIMYTDVKHGSDGEPITCNHQQVTLKYNHYEQCGRLVENLSFDGTLIRLPKTLGFVEGLRDMKPGGHRRIILPPKVTSFGEYRVVDVILHTVEKHMRIFHIPCKL